MNAKYNLIRKTIASVDDESREGKHQGNEGNIVILRRNFSNAYWHGNIVKGETTVHEKRANNDQPSSKICIRYHDFSVFGIRDVLPIPFDTFDAFADIIFM